LVVDDAMSVTATLHHLDCRRAQWTRTDQGFLGRHLSTTTRLVRMPFGNAARDPFCPTLVVNPSLEQVTLTLEEHGRYRATTVASYRPLGLTSPRHGLARSTTPLVTSWVTDGALIVRCGDMYWHFSLTGRDDPLGAEIRDREEVVLAISTALNPAEMENPEPLKRVLRADDLAAIVVPLNTTDPAPDLTGHTIIVNSDFAHADEASDLDWIPDEGHYPGPSYDPATGRFATGTGMDGPLYWQLNTPGIGVENGLIAGPPDIGKTNNLLVLAVEALSSQIFVYCAGYRGGHRRRPLFPGRGRRAPAQDRLQGCAERRRAVDRGRGCPRLPARVTLSHPRGR
jgi:hypothetical protein